MASFRPGVGDPLSSENPFSDGRPNWRLQTKTRTCKPPDMLGTGLQVDQPKVSPYTTEFSDLYKNHQASTQLVVKKQMRHFDHHLVQTTKEIPVGGLQVPEHLISGEDRIRPPGGRKVLAPNVKFNPNDGGVWEPRRREYPELSKRSSNSGVKIVGKPEKIDRHVDIWPADLTVRDQFKPGGLKIFQNKRSTNTEAFPGAIGYKPPLLYDEEGQMVDYSSVKMGGVFGRKRLHGNEPLKLDEVSFSSSFSSSPPRLCILLLLLHCTFVDCHASPQSISLLYLSPSSTFLLHLASSAHRLDVQERSATFFPDRTVLTRSKKAETSLANTLATEKVFPFRPDLPHARREVSHMKVEKQKDRGAVQAPESQPVVRERTIVVPPPPQTYSQQLTGLQTQIKKFSPREKLKYEFPLAPTTSWTFVGGYRP
uniref:Uncharacterized protein n=3 Tax=Guillardia theta TaxID=55529 RepID=A0A7S4H931_GUITH|mmetsp:Transcript_10807/g.36369  ORF Transcript_10807/g.36369 Transcript_10807/m.36369 type:complete len:425 (+) Transcript_10807:306-1580(+)